MKRGLLLLALGLACTREAPAIAPPPPGSTRAASGVRAPPAPTPPPRGAHNVILFIGDGMGPAAVRAAAMVKGGPLAFEKFPFQSAVTTNEISGGITDSAAAGTAIATGRKVANGVISVAIPGDREPLLTALEVQAHWGKRTGLITTATPLTDATPAAFGAHQASRGSQAAIADDYLHLSRPNVLFGPPGPGLDPAAAQAAGYTVVTDSASLLALDPTRADHVSGQFDAPPRLAELTRAALAIVGAEKAGFFLMVEHEGPDNGGHTGDLELVIESVLELEGAVEVALAYAAEHTDTLIVVTADHETGGLELGAAPPVAGALPGHRFTTRGHTPTPVGVYATGAGAEPAGGLHDDTELFTLLTGLPRPR